MKRLSKLLRVTGLILICGVIGVVVGALLMHSQLVPSLPELQLWHTETLTADFRADRADEIQSFDDYKEMEVELFAELDERIYARVPTGPANRLVRYSAGSASDPRGHNPDWNRSVELTTDRPAGGVLLLHGMSDGPYSIRALAEALHRHGYWVLALRLPGHGTVPAGLKDVTWEDTTAAVRLSMAHLASKVGAGPVHLVGYSTGAALAVEYALDALEGSAAPAPASLVLVSPAIGIAPVAALAKWKLWLADLTGNNSLAWTDVVPEFDPFRYNSFTTNAAFQVHRITSALAARVEAKAAQGLIEAFPPTLVFLSSVDATVSVDAVVDNLLKHLAPDRHELVLFDINRRSAKSTLLIADPAPLIDRLMANDGLPFALSKITNQSPEDYGIVRARKPALSADTATEPLGLAWPANVFSLSHVALPFPPDDPLYGRDPPESPDTLFLGQVDLQGERGLLLFSPDRLMRLRHNPFFAFVERQTIEWMDTAGGQTARPQANN